MPVTKIAAVNSAMWLAKMQPTSARTVSKDAPIIVGRSPNRCTSEPAGMSATIWPSPALATTSAAIAGLAPRSVAEMTMTGAIAPCPTAKTAGGTNAAGAMSRSVTSLRAPPGMSTIPSLEPKLREATCGALGHEPGERAGPFRVDHGLPAVLTRSERPRAHDQQRWVCGGQRSEVGAAGGDRRGPVDRGHHGLEGGGGDGRVDANSPDDL